MAAENVNVIAALFAFDSDGTTTFRFLGGTGVLPATLTRVGAGEYTIDLAQALVQNLPGFPAPGEVNFAASANIGDNTARRATVTAIDGAIPGRLDRLRINTFDAAGAPDDPEGVVSVTLFQFPSVF